MDKTNRQKRKNQLIGGCVNEREREISADGWMSGKEEKNIRLIHGQGRNETVD